jgi:transposase
MEAGENVSVLARELGVSRKSFINGVIGIGWASATFAQLPRSYAQSRDLSSRRESGSRETARRAPASLEELARAQGRIAALERKIGRQQVELDLFQQALRQVRG